LHPNFEITGLDFEIQIKMSNLSYKTRTVSAKEITREWFIIDAENEVLGRLASKVAIMLRGKHKAYYSPNLNCGDNIIIINAEKIVLTGNKMTDKEYLRYTGYPGGQRSRSPQQVLAAKPTAVIEHAVKGMLPRTRLGSDMYRHLFVYAGNVHPHEAQQPKEIKLTSIK
jgi:large subunit ribosomal protein L13